MLTIAGLDVLLGKSHLNCHSYKILLFMYSNWQIFIQDIVVYMDIFEYNMILYLISNNTKYVY